MDEKIRFIDEVIVKHQVEQELREKLEKSESLPVVQTNPIRANLMKFVNFKKKFNFKDIF